MKKILDKVFLLSFCLFFLITGNLSASARLEKGNAYGEAVDFSLESLETGEVVSLSNFKGKPMIMFFFTTWCPYCVKTLPGLSAKQNVYMKQQIQLLCVNVGESRRKVKAFVENKNLALNILLDADSQMAKRYGIIGVPTYILVDANGVIRYKGNDLPQNYHKLLKD